MATKVKIRKDDLKHDELREVVDQGYVWVQRFWQERRETALAIIIGVLVLALAVPGLLYYRDFRDSKAAGLLSEGKYYARQGLYAQDETTRAARLQDARVKFEEIARDWSGTASHPEALKTLGFVSAELGQTEAAATAYRAFLKEFGDQPDADIVRYALAGQLQDMRKYDEAIAVYEELRARPEAAFLKPYLAYQLASIYDAGLNNKEKAIEFYRQVEKPAEGETQLWYIEARHRLAALGAPLADEAEVPAAG